MTPTIEDLQARVEDLEARMALVLAALGNGTLYHRARVNFVHLQFEMERLKQEDADPNSDGVWLDLDTLAPKFGTTVEDLEEDIDLFTEYGLMEAQTFHIHNGGQA